MPTYDYECRRCGDRTDVIHSMLAEGPTTCERCGGELRRILHAAGIIFKGSGFYKTDARAAPTDARAAPTDGRAAPSEGSAATGAADTAADAAPAKPAASTPAPAPESSGSG